MIPYKIVVSTEDYATLFDCTIHAAKWHMTKVREKVGKPKRCKVTALDVATYAHVSVNEIMKAINREHW